MLCFIVFVRPLCIYCLYISFAEFKECAYVCTVVYLEAEKDVVSDGDYLSGASSSSSDDDDDDDNGNGNDDDTSVSSLEKEWDGDGDDILKNEHDIDVDVDVDMADDEENTVANTSAAETDPQQ